MVIGATDITDPENEVVATLRRHAAEYRLQKRFITVAMILVVIGLLATLIFGRLEFAPSWWSQIVDVMPWFLVFVGGAAMMARQQLLDSATRTVSFPDKRVLAPIVELLDSPEESERNLARQAIRRLLPLFTEEDFCALSSDQRLKLMESIRSCPDADFVTAVLTSAKKYGRLDCIAPIEDFVRGKTALRKSEMPWPGSLAHMALADIRMRTAESLIELRSRECR
jgi:hypothetical protein